MLRVGRAAAFSFVGAAAFAGTLFAFFPTAPRKVGPCVKWSEGVVVRKKEPIYRGDKMYLAVSLAAGIIYTSTYDL